MVYPNWPHGSLKKTQAFAGDPVTATKGRGTDAGKSNFVEEAEQGTTQKGDATGGDFQKLSDEMNAFCAWQDVHF